MNGFNQFGNQAYQPQAVGFQQQQQRTPFYKLQDGDNWIQLLSLQESEFTRQFPDNYGGMRNVTKSIRDVLVNGQQYALALTKGTNQQLQGCIQAVMSTGQNPLEFRFNIRRNRIGNMPFDVRYQVITGEWVGLNQALQQNAFSHQRTQAQQSPAPPMPFQQAQIGVQQPYRNAPKPQSAYMGNAPISKILGQGIQNPFQQGITPQMPQKPLENAIVLDGVEKTLLEMSDQTSEKLEKADFINKWVSAMRQQYGRLDYGVERAAIVFEQFYSK